LRAIKDKRKTEKKRKKKREKERKKKPERKKRRKRGGKKGKKHSGGQHINKTEEQMHQRNKRTIVSQ
jgi:hypothetical protein